MDQTEFKRYAISSLYTFISGFLTAVAAAFATTDWKTLQWGTIISIIWTGVRYGVKVAGEAYFVWRDKKN